MKMKFKSAAMFCAILSVSQTTVAAENTSTGSGPNPFSECGIGSALFPETPVAAVTSNVIWDVGTTALTSATASPETCSAKKMQAAMFINDTYESLAEETATGNGDHLTALLNIFNCNTESHGTVVSKIRSEMSKSVDSASYDSATHLQKASSFYNMVNEAVTSTCSA